MQHRKVGWYQAARGLGVILVCATTIVGAACSDSSSVEPLVATNIAAGSGSNAQSGVVGLTLASPISVVVTDQNGAPLSNILVTWSLPVGKGTLSSPTSTTNSVGNASVAWTLGTTSGVDSLTALLTGGTSVTITATALAAGLSSLALVSGDSQTVAAGARTAPFVVKAKDPFGNPVVNATVAWTSAAGGSLSAASTVTDSNGLAQVTLTTDASPATYSITASAGGAATVKFTANGT